MCLLCIYLNYSNLLSSSSSSNIARGSCSSLLTATSLFQTSRNSRWPHLGWHLWLTATQQYCVYDTESLFHGKVNKGDHVLHAVQAPGKPAAGVLRDKPFQITYTLCTVHRVQYPGNF